MIRRMICCVILAALFAAASILAHDAKYHKGRSTDGEVLSVLEDRITLKTETATKIILFTAKTNFEADGQKVTAKALKKGEKVNVLGTTLASGEIVATEILISTGAKKSGPASSHTGMGGMKH